MINIRKYRPTDYAQLGLLACALYATQHAHAADPSEPGVSEYIVQLLGNTEKDGALLLVAEHESELVGFVSLLELVVPEGREAGKDAYSFLSDLFVREDFRNKGTGSLLTNAAEQYARQAGASRIALKVLTENRDAVAFYRKMDYQEKFRVLSKSLGESCGSMGSMGSMEDRWGQTR